MKAVLTFNLPEEKYEYDLCQNAGKLSSIIYTFTNQLRNKTKYGDGKPVGWDEVSMLWWDILNYETYDPYNDE